MKKPAGWFALQMNELVSTWLNEWMNWMIWMNEYPRHELVNKEGVICHKFFVAADKINTFKLLNKNTINPKRIMVLC